MFNSSTQEAEVTNLHKFKANLFYTAGSWTVSSENYIKVFLYQKTK